MQINTSMDPFQVHANGKKFLLLDPEIGEVDRITSMAILPAGALYLAYIRLEKSVRNTWFVVA